MRVLTTLLLVFMIIRKGDASSSCPSRVPVDEACPQGCYHASQGTNSDGTRPCRPAGVGNYSPANDNRRYPCEFGTFSAVDTAGICSSCPAGTYASSSRANACDVCPIGTYSNLPRSIFCSPCDPENYDGQGANSIQVWNGKIFCSLIPGETDGPEPTMAPTQGDSTNHPPTSELPDPILEASVNDTIVQFEATDDGYDSLEGDEDAWCLEGSEYELHGECTECPSTMRTILHPIWITAFIVGTIVVISLLPASSTVVVWMGIEYIQLAYFLGLVPSGASSSPQNLVLLEHFHRWILSIFVLDLDAGFSWQCLLGLSPALDQMFGLILPVIVACTVWILSQAIPGIHVSRVVAVGFSLGHLKFVVTSLEALHCSGSDWFCHEPLLSSMMGVIGLALYGCLVPLWLLWNRYCHFKTPQGDTWSRDSLGFKGSWWWPGFWMIRRSLLATLPIILSEHPSWILTAYLVVLMASELIQRFASPFGDCDHQNQNRWFRTTTIDTILQASLISLTGLKFLALAMPPETMRADGVVIAILFLVVWIPSVGYWAAAMMYNHIQNRRVAGMEEVTSHGDNKSSASSSTTSSHQHRRSLPAPPSIRDDTASSPSSSPPSPPPRNISTEDPEDGAIHHSLSLIPHFGQGDDLDIETVLVDEQGDLPNTQLGAIKYSEWAGTRDSASRSVLLSHPICTPSSSHTEPDDFLQPSLHSNEDHDSFNSPPPPPPYFDNDDTSTLTDNNSYVPKLKQPHYHSVRPRPLNCSIFSDPDGVASLMESSGDGTPMIFADDETPPQVEYHIPYQYHEEREEGLDQDDDDDDVTEVWIDEETGLPVANKQSGEWADASTGLPVDSSSSASGTSRASSGKLSRSTRSSRKSSCKKSRSTRSSRK